MKFVIPVILFGISLFFVTISYAVECGETPPSGNIDALNAYIQSCNQKIESNRNEQNTLKQVIATINSKINLAQAQINQTETQIKSLEEEIRVLSGVLETVNISMDQLTTIYIARVRETYRKVRTNQMDLLLTSKSLSKFLENLKYISTLKTKDQLILTELERSRIDYDQKKNDKILKQEEVEKLKIKLLAQKKTLDGQQIEKQKLLAVTQNDEKKYKQLLDQALSEKNAIEKALVSGVKVGPIKKGDTIALTGNSGYPNCSTGKHLHLEIRKDGKWVDPGAYLSSKTVKNEQDGNGDITIGSGSWQWPIKDTVRLTQFYGKTPYSYVYKYSGGLHTGYDMVSTSSDLIVAPADGTLFKSSQACGSSTINIVYIEHPDNVISLYLHVQ